MSNASLQVFPDNSLTSFTNIFPDPITSDKSRKFVARLRSVIISHKTTSPNDTYVEVNLGELEPQRGHSAFDHTLGGFEFLSDRVHDEQVFHEFDHAPFLPIRKSPVYKLSVYLTDRHGKQLNLASGPPTIVQIELTDDVLPEQFTITCASNSELQKTIFPDNVMGDFKTHIPEQMILPKWEVAVSSVVFPENMREKTVLRFSAHRVVFEYDMAAYDDPDRLLEDIEADFKSKQKQTGMVFIPHIRTERNKDDDAWKNLRPGQKVWVFWRKRHGSNLKSRSVILTLNNVAHRFLTGVNAPARFMFLRKGTQKKMWTEHTLFDDADHISHLYCDIIEPHVVGDVQAPLLKILPTFKYKKQSKIQQYEPPVLHFHPLISRGFQSIRLSFYQTSGKKHVFLANDKATGILVTLLFRPIKKPQ